MFAIHEVCPAARSRMQRTVYKNNYSTVFDLHEGSKRYFKIQIFATKLFYDYIRA